MRKLEKYREKVIELYESNVRIKDIATRYKVSSHTVESFIKYTGIDRRKKPIGKKVIKNKRGSKSKLFPYKEEIIKLYNDRVSLKEIGKKYNVTGESVRLFLKTQNVSRRKPVHEKSGSRCGILDSHKDEVKSMYLEKGLNCSEIARYFGVSKMVVYTLLNKCGIKREVRSLSPVDKYKDDIIRLYTLENRTHKEIGEMFGVSYNSIRNLLIKYKSNKRSRSKLDPYKYDVIDRYVNEKLSIREISWSFGVAEITVINFLKKNNIKIRNENKKK